MDNLRKYIADNKDAFDLAEPSALLWEKIEGELPEKEVAFPLSRIVAFNPEKWLNWRVAASVLLIASLGYFAGQYSKSPSEHEAVMSLSPEYGSEVIQFASFIEERKEKLSAFSETEPQLLEVFNEDLEALSGHYDILKADLPNNPNQEELIKRMMENLNWQLEMLDQQLEVIQEKRKNEEADFVWSEEAPLINLEATPVLFV